LSKLAILAHRSLSFVAALGFGRFAAIAVLSVLGGVAAFGLAPDTTLETVPMVRVARDLTVPRLEPLPVEAGFWREESIQRGDTLGSVLARLGVSDPAAQQFLRTHANARSLYQLKPGKPLRVETDEDGRMLSLRYLAQSGDLLSIEREGDSFVASSGKPATATRLELRSGEIRSSLFATADAVGLPDAITTQLTEVFSGDVDFLHDVRRGDRFMVVYEVRQIEGEPAGTGRIVAAEYINKGVAYRAFFWRAPDGSEGYYTAAGKSLRKAFLRSPVEFSRITSGFSLARFHPFMQTWRAHKGVDFAAPSGTPVHAASDGNVNFAGQQSGYGNVVILQHRASFSTLYAHLSRFAPGVRAGSHVSQGDVIGYVGETGWATGPHLHYEFRVANEQRDPLRMALPDSQPIGAEQRSMFLSQIAPLAAQLAMTGDMTVASSD